MAIDASSELAAGRRPTPPVPAALQVDSDGCRLLCSGDWSVFGLAALDRRLSRLPLPEQGRWRLDTGAIGRMDTAGAVLLHQLLTRLGSRGCAIELGTLSQAHRRLLELVSKRRPSVATPGQASYGAIERLGRATVAGGRQLLAFVAFIGAFTLDVLPQLLRPWRIRGSQVVAEIYRAGVSALPIVGLLAFLMGVVIAYQGGIPLQRYGANIFLVDLVGITMLREMAPLLTAIVVAGRTGSSYAAQLGTMKITQEIDALRTLGLSPFQILVLPKLLALLIALPLLTVCANLLGIGGGVLIADLLFGIEYRIFLDRMADTLATSHFWVGMAKTPIFALIIALVGSFHGFTTTGSAESVGRTTTVSVVHCIFLVIAADALFSIVFSMLDL